MLPDADPGTVAAWVYLIAFAATALDAVVPLVRRRPAPNQPDQPVAEPHHPERKAS